MSYGIFDNPADAIEEAHWLADSISKPVAICDHGYPNMLVMPLSEADKATVIEVIQPKPWCGWHGEHSRSTDNANKEKQA